jgi:hypothetical protein
MSMQLPRYLELLHREQLELADAFRSVASAHADEADVARQCERLAAQCEAHAERLAPFVGEGPEVEPDLLADLHDLYRRAAHCDMAWTLAGQAAQGTRDRELLEVVQGCEGETEIQLKWLRTRLKQAAPQALVVA